MRPDEPSVLQETGSGSQCWDFTEFCKFEYQQSSGLMRLTFFENVTHNIVKGKTVYIKMIAVDHSHLGNIYHDSQKNDLKLK